MRINPRGGERRRRRKSLKEFGVLSGARSNTENTKSQVRNQEPKSQSPLSECFVMQTFYDLYFLKFNAIKLYFYDTTDKKWKNYVGKHFMAHVSYCFI
jgi:hypothetical protein